MAQGALPARVRSARLSVAAIFFINSIVLTAWITRIPDIKAQLALSEGMLGIVLLAMAMGALIAQPLVGILIGLIGSRSITTIGGVLFCMSVLLPALAGELWLLMGALFIFGALNGGLDVAMNAQAAQIEQHYDRPIMASFHGLWSVGGLVGSGLGGLVTAQGLPVTTHFAITGGVALVALLVASRWLWPDRGGAPGEGPAFALPPRALLALSFVAFLVLLCEGAVADWSAVYLRDDLGSAPGLAAAGYAGFALMMAVGRLTGDWLTAAVGAKRIVLGGGVLIALGMVLALAGGTAALAILGLAAVGAGCAGIFPILISAASRTPGVPSGQGIAGVATAGYTGFLVGPPLIGTLAELISLRGALGTLIFAGVFVTLLAGTVQRSTTPQHARALSADAQPR